MVQLGRIFMLAGAALPLLVSGSALGQARGCPVVDTSIIAHTGKTVGHVKDVAGGTYPS